jgi:solute carrier family 13 (sodium-dependent dicarboxylate transporter), member 2/3/5
LPVTALAVPLLIVLAGLMPPRQALAPFAHPVIFLFLGGFALAAALQRQGLDRAMASSVLRLARGSRLGAVLLLAALTAVLSMWMSNTATAAMMLPLALGLLNDAGVGRRQALGSQDPGAQDPGAQDPRSPDPGGPALDVQQGSGAPEQAFVLLALAYSASIGGIATLVGSPPNAIAAAQAGIGFADWLRVGLPMALLLWPLMLLVLAMTLRPRLGGSVALPSPERLVMTRDRVVTVAVFAGAVAGWVGGAPLGRALGVAADIDTLVALAAIVALVAGGALDWRDLERHAQWGVLLLFGGGLALSDAMAATGASRYLGESVMQATAGLSPVVLLVAVVGFVVFLTELVSNTASAALLLPVLLPMSAALGLPPASVAAAIAVSASCAFMLPVATPPNAIVFATERVPQATMMRCGLWLNLVCIAVIAAMTFNT